MNRLSFSIVLACLVLASGSAGAKEPAALDWSAWRSLPVFHEGRMMPLQTFAREYVETICGRARPRLAPPEPAAGSSPWAAAGDLFPGGKPRKFTAEELLFSWLVEPEKWRRVPFLRAAHKQLRQEVLRLPQFGRDGRRLRFVAPRQLEKATELWRCWADLQRRARREGDDFQPVGVDRSLYDLVAADRLFDDLTYQPLTARDAPERYYDRLGQIAETFRIFLRELHRMDRLRDSGRQQEFITAFGTIRRLAGLTDGTAFSPEKLDAATAAFRDALARLTRPYRADEDQTVAAVAADLAHQADELHLALYDNGSTLRLVPALSAAALEVNRIPEDDAHPWLSWQALLTGSPELLKDYPPDGVQEIRTAWADASAAYRNRDDPGRAEKFSTAMKRFAAGLRKLGKAIEPQRAALAVLHRDDALLAATAYPPEDFARLELFYNRLDPFFWSWIVSLVALLLFALGFGVLRTPLFWLGMAVLMAAQAVTLTGFGLRMAITKIVPLTGMYETTVFVSLCAGLLGAGFALSPALWPRRNVGWREALERVMDRKIFALMGAGLSGLAALIAYSAPATIMHRGLEMPMPILRDNFWLAAHVVTIVASYGAGALAWGLGNRALGYYLLGRYRRAEPPTQCTILANYVYKTTQVAVVLLAAGTILGALWADVAWGRFWGWDAKEVWSLVSLLAYMVILHGRYTGWWGNFGLAVGAVLGFTCIVLAWYGVNYLFGSGLHSYATGTGGQEYVLSAIALNWLFLLAAAVRYQREIHSKKRD